MKIHYCYFCDYQTHLKHNLRTHVTKQKKCSYLIQSIPINSLDDYYNLRDLHKENPDDPIWGEDPELPQSPYYDSDDDETLDIEVKEKKEKNTEYVDNLIDKHLNNTEEYKCEYCYRNFSRKDHLKRHLNGRCKVLKQKEQERIQNELAEAKKQQTLKELEDKELRDQILLLKTLMDQHEEDKKKMKDEIKLLKENGVGSSNTDNSIRTTNSNNTTNNIETQQITQIENQQINNEIKNEIKNEITINTFGRENKDIFKDENYMLSWIEKPFNAIPHMVEKLHFCPKSRPENTNIRINNISNGKSQIYKNGVWKTIMRYELIYDLVNECAQKLIDTYEMYVDEGKIKRMDRFEKFMRQFEKDDPYFVKSQNEKMDCKLIDLMKKHKTYLNSLG